MIVIADEVPKGVVTALRARGNGRVDIELDGHSWRLVPAEAVYVAGLSVGNVVDRATARSLGRELRRLEARAQALQALRSRDHTVASLEQRLADRGLAPGVRRLTLEAARRAGLVDDRRFARDRATLLAGRGAGNHFIRADLERCGVSEVDVCEVLELLEPESSRAARIIEVRGRTARTARHLAAKGFSEETLETLVAELSSGALD